VEPLHVVAGIILLILGRELFWVFVAALGFVTGMDLATRLVPDAGPLLVLVAAIGLGVLGAVLAYFFYQVAIAVAGFVAGGRLAIAVAAGLTPLSMQSTWVAFVIGGVIGAVLLLLIFDWALIVISSMLGAAFIVEATAQNPLRSLLFIALVIAGIAVQASLMRRHAPAV
jgi:Domain of unknown function (DUF4203)